MSCAGLRGRALAECKKKAGRVKRDSIKKDRRFSNTTNPGIYSRPDNSPAGIARGRKFEKDNDYEGWKSMKRLEKKQNRANNLADSVSISCVMALLILNRNE